ncbi:ABC transporter ATP-binding protein [Nocardioides sp.]|uniref:ABC transporter ATP-binding protein n=1 Tax=Nocardioides sp. TaxID=35761 RepID=UPI003511842D
MSSLDLHQLVLRYPGGTAPALAGVDLSVASGELLAVIGPSGSGKSSLLRVAAGLTPLDAGRIVQDGVDVTGVPIERRAVTMLFQHPLLFDHLDVLDNVAFPLRAAGHRRRAARERAALHLARVGLSALARRRPDRLSGGQQQRVALARALAAARPVLLLDEPFSALDRETREQMHDLLADLRREDAPTVVLVTHDLDEAAGADRVAVLIDGVVVQVGTWQELRSRPATVGVARLLGGWTEVPGTVRDGVHHSTWGRVVIEPSCPITEGAAVLLCPTTHWRLTLAPTDAVLHAGPGLHLQGVMERLRIRDGRSLALVGADGTTVEVPLAAGESVPTGAAVALNAPLTRGWAVPTA